jgi:hypothetical protein
MSPAKDLPEFADDIPSDTPGWTEQTVPGAVHWIGPADPWPVADVGSAAIFFDDIFDADGNKVGRTVGYTECVEKRESDGHIIVNYHEAVELPDGTLKATGTVDQNVIFTNGWVHLDMVGTSGKYLGAQGTRSYRALPPLHERKAEIRMSFGL